MGKINWGGFAFDSKWLVQTKKCVTCREDFPEEDLNVNGMCDKCIEIENKMLERLAGKWANMVLEKEDKKMGWW